MKDYNSLVSYLKEKEKKGLTSSYPLLKIPGLNTKLSKKTIKSHPLLKKYFSKKQRRKPKRLDSELAKKLEGIKHRLRKQFEVIADDFYKILEVIEIPDKSLDDYIIAWENTLEIKKPTDKKYRQIQILSELQKELEMIAGKEEAQPVEGLSVQEQIRLSQALGSKYFKD